MSAFAQASPPSLPPLPTLPSVPVAPTPGMVLGNNNAALTPAPTLPASDVALTLPPEVPTGSPTPPATVTAPPPTPEAREVAQAPKMPQITALPEINVPTTPSFSDTLALGGPMTSSPQKRVVQKAPSKTWETRLAPVSKPWTTRFNYKRQLLPSTIYKTGYSRENGHLPYRVTRGDYEGLLFASIAQRNLNATRALLNAGTDINTINAYGETPRAFAERIGARDVAVLLAARGGR